MHLEVLRLLQFVLVSSDQFPFRLFPLLAERRTRPAGKPSGFSRQLSMRMLCLDFIYWQYLFAMTDGQYGYLFFFDMVNDPVITINKLPELMLIDLRNN